MKHSPNTPFHETTSVGSAFSRRDMDPVSNLPQDESGNWNRRNFLKAAGFSFAAALTGACQRAPVEYALSALHASEESIPGRAVWYASTCGACQAGCGLLIKCRDGRPIKVEGNPDHPISHGGVCAVGQASLLGLYDNLRLRGPEIAGKKVFWNELDSELMAHLERIRQNGLGVRFLSRTITSPTTQSMIQRFLSGFADAKHVIYDPLSCSAMLDAYERTHGVRILPHCRFDRAETIVSIDADFLGTWISPVEYAFDYQTGRRCEDIVSPSSMHYQFESRLSLTGSKADRRICVKSSELVIVIHHLARIISQKANASFEEIDLPSSPVAEHLLDQIAAHLWNTRGKSLVICGIQDVHAQVLCNYINHLLDNYGHTLDWDHPSLQRSGNDRELESFLQELFEGKVAALFLGDVNPVAELPQGDAIARALPHVPVCVNFAERVDETSSLTRFLCPDHHYFESWKDVEAVSGVISLKQPLMQPLWNTRAMLESLSAWMGSLQPAYELIQHHWEESIYPRQSLHQPFLDFWERTVHDGYATVAPEKIQSQPFDPTALRAVGFHSPSAKNAIELVFYPKVGMLDGSSAYNPWLQELPDPITKTTWDNYACLAPEMARRLEVEEGDVIRIEATDDKGNPSFLELPVYIQPGQHQEVVAVAVGYGRKASERFAQVGPDWLHKRPTVGADGRVGKNVAPLLAFRDGVLQGIRHPVQLVKTGKKVSLATTQMHHTITLPKHLAYFEKEPRPIIQEISWEKMLDDSSTGVDPTHHPPQESEDLWPSDHEYRRHHWGMVIDLEACTGCSACVIACQVENNIPVVGKDEVHRSREMHWIRIDRYYLEHGEEFKTAHQPMMCHQCDHAPCETVCPVLAAVHSEEGLSQQIYNRCVGTRYCSNNCPYKVRRFNWFNYPHPDPLQNLVLNPDVTVRSRGVMEKCSFCVQRIQETKFEIKRQGKVWADGDIRTACQQSCPTQAIVFGDTNDPDSQVSRLSQSRRYYRVLEELNVRPSVGYLSLVRKPTET